MSCNDIPSLLDLQKAKLNADDFGRLMGTGTGTSTNGVTGQVRPTYNAVMANLGYTRVGTFAAGATLLNGRQTLLWDVADGGDGQEYGWSGSFLPSGKVVPPGSTPLTTGGIAVGAWMSRFDPALRVQVREALRRSYAEAGYNLVDGSFEAGGTLVNTTDALLQERTGKAFSGPAGVVAAGTNPASGGFVDVSHNVNATFESVAEMKASDVIPGRMYRTKGYYSPNDGGWAEYFAVPVGGASPDGYGDHLAANGVILQLMSNPTDLRHGVKLNSAYVPAEARNNRNALQAMMRNARWSHTECRASGKYYLLGSVNIGRDNIQLHIHKGCFIRGRYSDPSIPTPDQAGHMLGFAHFFDPDNGDFIPFASGDTRVNAPIKNVTVILDGDVSTEYNAVHTNKYNNNAIGFLKGVDCRVVGSGGVSESDHRGIIFDGVDTNAPGGSDNRGGSVNCHIDVSYINNCVDNPAAIVADINTPSLNTITIGRVGVMKSGGYNDPIVVNVFNEADFVVKIGSFIGDNVVKPALVVARNARSVKVRVGLCNGAKSLLYSDLTLDNDVECEEIYNTPLGLVRAGSVSGKCRTMRLAGVKATDSNFAMAYSSQNNTGPFLRLSLTDNNFASVANSFQLFGGKNSTALPRISDIRDNILPDTLTTITELNMLPSGFKVVPITVNSTSETVNYKAPDWNYSKMSIIASDAGGVRYQMCVDLKTRDVTNQTVNLDVGTTGGVISTTKSGSSLVLTCTSCNLQAVTLHN